MTEPEQEATPLESDQPMPSPEDPVDSGLMPSADLDLDAIERDLSAVEVALSRLAEGTYWTDEVTGAELPDPLLAADPTARRV